MNANEVYPSKFLKAVDFSSVPTLLTITDVSMESMPEGPQKPVLTFREVSKRLIVNKTNWGFLVKFLGADTDSWVGNRVALVAAEVDFKGDTVLSIRIRQAPQQSAQARSLPLNSRPQEDEIPF